MVVLGGLGSRWGAILGGVLYTYLDHRLAALGTSDVVTDLPQAVRAPLSEPLFLLADAAHPMSPMLGQGANMALEDAACLADQLAQAATLPEAFTANERFRVRRANKYASMSRMLGRLGHLSNPLGVAFRDTMIRLMMRGNPDKANADLYAYRP